MRIYIDFENKIVETEGTIIEDLFENEFFMDELQEEFREEFPELDKMTEEEQQDFLADNERAREIEFEKIDEFIDEYYTIYEVDEYNVQMA